MNKLESIKYYLDLASRASQNSKCKRRRVGAIAVRDQQIIGDAFNGTPRGWKTNLCEILIDNQLVTNPIVIHAEANLLAKLSSRDFLTLSGMKGNKC